MVSKAIYTKNGRIIKFYRLDFLRVIIKIGFTGFIEEDRKVYHNDFRHFLSFCPSRAKQLFLKRVRSVDGS